MKRSPALSLSKLALGLLAVYGSPRAIEARVQTEESRSADFARKAAEYMQARVRVTSFSGAVLVAKDGQPLLRTAYGLASRAFDVPNTPETRFRLGSVTKQFTAAAILLLEHRDKLRVTDLVGDHLAGWPVEWADVTIHHLLSHTAGLPRLTVAQPLPDVSGLSHTARIVRPASVLDLAQPAEKSHALDFPAGEGWAYSNIGYVLLGEIIEKASGKTYADFLREDVFVPSGMNATGIEDPLRIEHLLADGYAPGDGEAVGAAEFVDAGYVNLTLCGGAGAAFSTVDDLLAWDGVLASEKLLPVALRDRLFTSVRADYGYGWWVQEKLGRKAHWHRGSVQGFVAILVRFPAERLFVAVLSNTEDTPVLNVATELAAIALGEPYELPRVHRVADVDPAVFDAFLGSYHRLGHPDERFTLRREGKRFWIGIPGSGSFEVFAESATELFTTAPEWDLRFVPDESGRLADVVLRVWAETSHWAASN